MIDEDVYQITEHLGLHHGMGAAVAPGSGAANYWRYMAVHIGSIWDISEDEYDAAHEGSLA